MAGRRLRGRTKTRRGRAELDALAHYRALCSPEFDFEKANAARVFFEELFTFSKGEWQGRPFKVEDWQFRDIFCPVFGKVDAEGRRIIRNLLLGIPRKNGKTEFAAGLALYLLTADAEPGAEIYSAAPSRDQARTCFKMAATMVRQSPILSKLCTVYKNEIVTHKGGIYTALSAEAKTKHSFSASGIVFDEVHAFGRDRELWDVLTSSMGARRTPLMIAISTQSDDELSLYSELYRYSKKVEDFRARGEEIDPAWHSAIYEADKEDPWDSEEIWRKANPNYGVSINPEFMRQECARAKEIPGQQKRFRLLHLNQKVEGASKWLSMERFDRCRSEEIPDLAAAVCYGGLDMSTNHDLTAFVLAFPLEGKQVWYEPFFWIPESCLVERERKNLPTYRGWADQGFLKIVPGEVIDFEVVKHDIMTTCEKYDVREIAVDRFQAAQLSQEFMKAGLKIIGFGQGFYSMGPATKELERNIFTRNFFYAGNPVLRFCFSNVELEFDPAGAFKLSKKKAKDRIDGAVACAMSLARLNFNEATGTSVYEEEGLTGKPATDA